MLPGGSSAAAKGLALHARYCPSRSFFNFFSPGQVAFSQRGYVGKTWHADEAGRAARLPQRCVEEPWSEASTAANPQQNQELPSPEQREHLTGKRQLKDTIQIVFMKQGRNSNLMFSTFFPKPFGDARTL